MIDDFCNGYFGVGCRVVGNFIKWKIYYVVYCFLFVDDGEIVFEDICVF